MTLVELLVAASLMTIVSTVAVSSGMNTAAMRASEAACRIQADLGYAQTQAILLRKATCVVFDRDNGTYHLARAATASTPIVDPISKKECRVFFSKACKKQSMQNVSRVEEYADVDLVTASFDGANQVTFNALGLPIRTSGDIVADGKIEITVGNLKLAVVLNSTTGGASVLTATANPQSGLFSWLLGGSGI